MCLYAMYLANIKDIYYAESVDQATNAGLGTSKFIYNELKLAKQDRTVAMKQLPIDDKVFSPIHNWKDKQ